MPALQVANGRGTIADFSGRQMRQEQPHDEKARLMAQIKGDDHQALAVLLDYRVGQLEEKVEENGRSANAVGVEVAKVSVKIDTLIDLHHATAARLDAHLDKGDAPPPPSAPKFALTPMWLFAGASAIAAWAAAAYVAGRAATERFVTWFLNFIGA